MEIGIGEEPEVGADVERQLDGDGVEVVFNTGLANEGEGELGVTILVAGFVAPHGEAGTDTGIPAEAVSDFTGPLVDTGKADVGVVVIAAPTKVGLETLTHEAPLGGKFGTITLTAANADTEGLNLCAGHSAHSKNGHDSNKQFLHFVLIFNVLLINVKKFHFSFQMQK